MGAALVTSEVVAWSTYHRECFCEFGLRWFSRDRNAPISFAVERQTPEWCYVCELEVTVSPRGAGESNE